MSINLKLNRDLNEMAGHMPNSKALHEQLAIILGALTKAAVAEICEVVDEGYAVFQLEISRSHKENEDLKKKLHLIESIIARGNASAQALLETGTDTPSSSRESSSSKQRQDIKEDNEGALTAGDAYFMGREELPDVVLIKDEDSDVDEDGAKASSAGSVGVASAATRQEGSPAVFRNRMRTWAGNDSEGALQSDPRKKTSKLAPKRPSSRSSVGKRRTTGLQFTHATSSEPGCSGQLEDDEMGTAEPVPDYHSDTDPDVLLVQPDHPDVPPVSDITNSQAYFEAHGDAVIDSPPNKLELDLCSAWAKQRKTEMAFTQFHQSENADETFGLKLISVSGSTSTHCQPSEMNTAMDYDGSDLMSFTVYDEQSNRSQHGELQMGANAKGKRYICPLCSKNFATSQNLDVHMRIHTGERPFSCAQCGKRFTQSAHLKSHLNVHTGERPYACNVCGKSFIVKYSMKLHMKKCHPSV